MRATKKGQNVEAIHNNNLSLVMQLLCEQDTWTRVNLSKACGLKQATITKLIGELMDAQLVRETGNIEGEKGRRSIAIQLNADRIKVLAVRLSKDLFQVGLFNVKGRKLSLYTQKTDINMGIAHIVAEMKRKIDGMMAAHPDICAIGMAVPGPYWRGEGRIVLMADRPGWQDISFNDEFRDAYGVPVVIEHDANAGAFAEWRYGHFERQNVTLINFLVGEGVGSGVVENGRMLFGCNGVAGEVGHMSIDYNGKPCSCGNRGCLRLYCASIAFVERVKEKLPSHPESTLYREKEITPQGIFRHAAAGDAFCAGEVRRVGRFIGYGVAGLVNLYDPNVIMISDIMAQGGDLLLEQIKETTRRRVLPALYSKLLIDYSPFGEEGTLYGAAAIGADALLRNYSLIEQRFAAQGVQI